MGKLQKLDEDDFFKMNKTFSIWLMKKKNKKFDDLSTNKQRKYFKKFIKKWNKSDLSSVYYDEDKLLEKYGFLIKQNDSWNIQKEDNQVSKMLKEYQDALEGVNQAYDFKSDEARHSKELKKQNRPPNENRDDDKDEVKKTRNEIEYDRENQRDQKRQQDKYDRRRERKNQEDILEDLVPKKVGKEAMLEKKKMTNQKMNGARDNTGIDDYDDDFLIGGDSFQQAKAREEAYQRKRQEKQQGYKYEMNQKRQEYRQQEDTFIQAAQDKSNYMNKYR